MIKTKVYKEHSVDTVDAGKLVEVKPDNCEFFIDITENSICINPAVSVSGYSKMYMTFEEFLEMAMEKFDGDRPSFRIMDGDGNLI